MTTQQAEQLIYRPVEVGELVVRAVQERRGIDNGHGAAVEL